MGSQEDFYKTDADAMQALSSLYNSWGTNSQVVGLHYNWQMTKNLLSDELWAGGGGRGDNSEMGKTE